MDKSKLAGRFKTPLKLETTRKNVLKETNTNNGAKPKTFMSSASCKTRRSKSFCFAANKVLKTPPKLKPAVSSSNLTKLKMPDTQPTPTSRLNITARINTGLNKTISNRSVPLKRQAPPETPNGGHSSNAAPSAPKISKFDYKGRFNLLDQKYKTLVSDHKALKAQHDLLEEQTKTSLSTIQTQSEQLKRQEQTLLSLQKEYEEHKVHTASLIDEIQVKLDKSEILNLKLNDELEASRNAIVEFKAELRAADLQRKVLHNQVQDLKGNIRVFCRVRPMKPDEEDRLPCNINFPDDSTLELKKTKESISSLRSKPMESRLEFNFDRVFSETSTQTEVFEDLAQLVQSTLDGYNVCVFAYGQTGSGKTYTMLGEDDNLGMIPRSMELLFQRIKELEKRGWTYEVQVSFLEIYNETIKDLLKPDSKKTYDILYNEGRGSTVTNLHVETVHSAAMMKKLMILANRNRAVAATDFNLHSSRSHAVTKILVTGYFEQNQFRGSLNLVDLAGSESAKHSDRMQETKSINKSLSSLGTVMLALYNKESHIPYRNSKLTYLLQSSLGGNSKTVMFVNVSPLEDCYGETVNSLRFASKVKEVKTRLKRNKIQN